MASPEGLGRSMTISGHSAGRQRTNIMLQAEKSNPRGLQISLLAQKNRNWSLGGWVFYIDRWVRGWTRPGCVCWQPRKPTLSSTKVGSQRIKSHLPVLQTELSDCLKIFPLPHPLYIYSNKPIIHFKLPSLKNTGYCMFTNIRKKSCSDFQKYF